MYFSAVCVAGDMTFCEWAAGLAPAESSSSRAQEQP